MLVWGYTTCMPMRSINTLANLDAFAEETLSTLPQKDTAHVLALSGELGAGKTTFVQTLAKKLGVHEHVTSPTFVIMRTYETTHETFTTLVHIDAYRVEDAREMEVLAIPELFNAAGTIVCIEWPERIASLIPKDARRISFILKSNDSRTVEFGT